MTWLRGTATVSADHRYRYLLTRRWGDGPAMCWIMLNPSTAGASEDDPTIGRCIGFARREGCEAIHVVNLFALRCTDPGELRAAADPAGPGNDGFLLARPAAALTVAAWGAFGGLNGRGAQVRAMLAPVPLLCLGVTSAGEPKHPLYVRGDAPFVPFPVSVPPARSVTFHGSAAGRVLSPAKPGGSTDG